MDNYKHKINQLKEILNNNPANIEAWSMLGSLQMTSGEVLEAEKSFRQILKVLPDSAETFANIAVTLKLRGDLLQAEQFLSKAIRLRPDNLEMRYQLATVLAGMGQHGDAFKQFELILNTDPNFNNARIGKACVLELQGNYEDAYLNIQGVLASGVNTVQAILPYARLSPKFGDAREAIAKLEESLANESISADEIRQVHITLGKLLDGLGEFDSAFDHYRQYNELKSSSFDPEEHRTYINNIMSVFDERPTRVVASATHSRELIFIIGLPRTGTTLAEQILASHPEVFAGGEMLSLEGHLNSTLPGFNTDYPALMTRTAQDTLNIAASGFQEQVEKMCSNAKYVTINGRGNEFYLGLISQLFPNSRAILCSRDPLDSCLSCYFQDFTSAHDYACNLEHLGLYYNEHIRLMKYWEKNLKIPVFNLEYESLIARPNELIPELIAFCDLEWNDQCLRFYDNKRSITTPSHEQVRKPIYASSVKRWHHYRKHLKPLMAALKKTPGQDSVISNQS